MFEIEAIYQDLCDSTKPHTFLLADDSEPEGGVELDLCGRDQDRVVTAVDAAQTPQHEAQPAVGVETERHVTRRVELALQLHRATQRRARRVRHLTLKRENTYYVTQ